MATGHLWQHQEDELKMGANPFPLLQFNPLWQLSIISAAHSPPPPPGGKENWKKNKTHGFKAV